MAVDSYSLSIPASGQVLLPNPGNFFFLLTASAAVGVLFQSRAAREFFQGLTAGLRVQRLRSWDSVVITGTNGTTVTVFYGTETPREDSTDFVQTIATIAGSVLTIPGAMTGGATDHADVTVAATTVDTTITANAARKFVLIGSFSTNAPATGKAGNLRVIAHGSGTGKGVELQPGQFISYQENTAFDVNNPDTGTQKYWWQELS